MGKSLIQVAQRFQRSVNLESDYLEASAIRSFVVSPLAWETVGRIVLGLTSQSGSRAWAIVGPYGSGKSSFAAFLANLLGTSNRRAALKRIRESWKEEAKDLAASLRSLGDGLLPVPIVGERAPLALIIIRALEKAFNAHWTGPGPRPKVLKTIRSTLNHLEHGQEVSDAAVVELVLEAARTVERTHVDGSGLCLILDEFGKSLEWAALHPEKTDLYLLQLLAEMANREEDANFLFLTIQHQGIEAYADRLSIQQQREWEKVGGRFEAIPYLESPRHLTRLVAEAIRATGKVVSLKSWKDHTKAIRALGRAAVGELPVGDLERCFPIHPASAMVLGPLFRLDLGQNERSLFSFLSSREPNGFQEFLEQWNQAPATSGLFGLARVYDYILANTRVLLATGSGSRVWRTAEEAIRRLPRDSGEVEECLVKSVALLSLVGSAIGLAANEETLSVCLGISKKGTAEAIRRLEDASILIFRQFKANYQLWDGSDLDVGVLLKEGRDRVAELGDLAGQVSAVYSLPPFLAARHYLETGTLRTFECRFLSAHDHFAQTHYDGDADGLIALVLPEHNVTIPESSPGTEFVGKPILSLNLDGDSQLASAILDYLGSLEARRSTSALENDPIARRALDDFRLTAWDRLQEQLSMAFHGVTQGAWHWNGRAVTGISNLSELGTQALSKAYSGAPHIHNELLNRATLSSAAAAARRELLERLLVAADQDQLGIEGHPPVLSMYLSVIKESKLHQPGVHSGPHAGLVKPGAGAPLHGIWIEIEQFFNGRKGKRVQLSNVYLHFAGPPYGIRDGLLPVLLFCYLLVNQETAFLYEDGSFIPAVEKDHVQRFLSRPQTFEIQKLTPNRESKAVLAATAQALGLKDRQPQLLPTTKLLIQSAAELSSFARQTQRVSLGALRLRAALVSARDPLHLIQKAIPKALDLSIKEKGFERRLTQMLMSSLRELKEADARLVGEIGDLLIQAFGRGSLNGVAFNGLRDRANRVDLDSFPVQPLARVVQIFLALDGDPDEDWFRQFGLALVGKPVLQWRDEDLPIFRSVLFEAARQFAAAEAGSTDLTKKPGGGAGQVELTSLAWLTNRGGYDTAVARITPETRRRLKEAVPELESLAEKHSLPLRELLAAALIGEIGVRSVDPIETTLTLEASDV